MSSSQTASTAALFLSASHPERERHWHDDAETALGYWHRTCAVSEAVHPRLIPLKPVAPSDEQALRCSVEELVAAIASGSVHTEQSHMPTLFSSTHEFENFLREIDVLYRGSVDRWGHSIKNLQGTLALNNHAC